MEEMFIIFGSHKSHPINCG